MLRVASSQLYDKQDAIAGTLLEIMRVANQAIESGVSLICFPECYLQGYTRDASVAKNRALSMESEHFRQICAELNVPDLTLIIGFIEIHNGKLYNTAVVLQNSTVLGFYRKTHPQEGIFEAGSDYPVFTIDGVRVGINICYDANFPEAAEALRQQDVHLICYLLNNVLPNDVALKWRHRHLQNLQARALETGAWVLSSDVIGQSQNHRGYGHTALVNPKGVLVDCIAEHTTGILMHDLR